MGAADDQLLAELAETQRSLPILAHLPTLFTHPTLFDSCATLAAAGFKLVPHSKKATKHLLVAAHRATPGYLFKKYVNGRPAPHQVANYLRRVEGARRLRTFLAERGFTRVVAPRKWLCALPSFPAPHLVVADALAVTSKERSAEAYAAIDKVQLRELATVLFYFRGLNSTPSNLPYTTDGRIALIDTERWPEQRPLLWKIGDHLSSKRRRLAEAIHADLRRCGEQPFQ